MAFQKGFYGVGIAGEDTGSKGLVRALGSMSKSMEKYGEYVGTEQDKEVMAQAQKAARIDNFKSYQDSVDSGEIENTKSDFYIAHYDNIKGSNAGSVYQTKKNMAYQEFWANQTNEDQDDIDGSGYLAWSQNYDKENLQEYKNASTYFQKGLDTAIGQVNQNLSARYSSDNAKRLKEKYKFLYIERTENIIKSSTPDTLFDNILNLDKQSQEFRTSTKIERKDNTIQSFKNVISSYAREGELDSDYFKAIELAEELRDYTGPNGFSFLQGKDKEEWDKYIQTLRNEKVSHDQNVILKAYGKEIDDAIDTNQKQLWGDMTSTYNNIGGEGAFKANFAKDEYEKRAKSLLAKATAEGYFDPADLKNQLTQLQVDIKEKYDNILDLEKEVTSFAYNDFQKFNIRKDKNQMKAMFKHMQTLTTQQKSSRGTDLAVKPKTFQEALFDLKDDDKYSTLISFAMASAKLNGYVNKDGKVTGAKLGEWYAAYSEFVGDQLQPSYNLIRPDGE